MTSTRVVPKSCRPKGQPRSTRNEFPIRASDRPRKFSKTSDMAAQAWWKLTAKEAVLSPEKRDLRYCWRSLRLLWVLKCSWSCIVSNPFINVLSICLVPLAGITEENSTFQRDILNYSNICWHVHHLELSLLNCVVGLDFCRFLQP